MASQKVVGIEACSMIIQKTENNSQRDEFGARKTPIELPERTRDAAIKPRHEESRFLPIIPSAKLDPLSHKHFHSQSPKAV